jgi:hypothetical protein
VIGQHYMRTEEDGEVNVSYIKLAEIAIAIKNAE